MARDFDPHRLTSPRVFLLTMLIFLIISGFLVAILYPKISTAFATNPGLNGLIVGVLVVGILLALMQVIRLFREVRWVNSFKDGMADLDGAKDPILLQPMKALLGQSGLDMALSTTSTRAIMDSVAVRLDEMRDISRYLIGLLVFLGLLGTFWGLLGTIESIGNTIASLDPQTGDINGILDSLKSGLKAPLDGMGTAFSSSLFGLAGSLILGFLDLQAGRAQNRFYTELENWLASVTDMRADMMASSIANAASGEEAQNQFQALARNLQDGNSPRVTSAIASLAEGIQGLVQHMRADQQIMRDYVRKQAQQQEELHNVMKNIDAYFEKKNRKNDKASHDKASHDKPGPGRTEHGE